MLLSLVVLACSLGQCYRGIIQFLAGQGSLPVEILPAGIHLLSRIQTLLRRLHVQLGFLPVFREGGAYVGFIGGLGLLVCSLVEIGRASCRARVWISVVD